MKAPKLLSKHIRYWGKYEMDGGLATIRVKIPKGVDPYFTASAYSQRCRGPGQYFADVLSVKHSKRREWIVEVRFGWDI